VIYLFLISPLYLSLIGVMSSHSPSASLGFPVSDGMLSGGSASRSPAAAGGGDVEDKFDELAGAVFQHCRKQLNNDDDDEQSFYPIAEQQQKRKLEQQISNRCSCLHDLSTV